MPVSYHETYETFKQWIRFNKPQTAWDIGMGYGNIGAMAQIEVPTLELNGLEGWLPYLHSVHSHNKRFKRIMIADLMQCIGKLWPVDAVFAFDVIEHLDREDGVKALNYLRSISNMSLLVSVPIVDYAQGALEGNDYEIHRTQWKIPEMEELGAKTIFHGQVLGLFEFKKV